MGFTSSLKSRRSKRQTVLPATTPPPQPSTSLTRSASVPVPTSFPIERENRYGLLPLHITSVETLSSTERQYPIDIIAIHGITGDAYTTWTSHPEKPSSYFWLRDSLPKELPGARIYSYGYPANVAFTLDTGNFDSFARGLLEAVSNVRMSKEEQRRPIIFICHSMGGIVVKKALNLCVVEPGFYSTILSSVSSIFFLSTPHGGSNSADLAAVLGNITNMPTFSAVSRWTGKTNVDLIASLKRNAEPLFIISREFRFLTERFKILSFIEQRMTPGINQRIVDDNSGSLNVPTERVVPMAGCDHRTICCFDNENSQGYKMVLRRLQVAADEATTKFENEIQAEDIPCLHSLAFPAMDDRLSSIPRPHPQTCTWLLTHPCFQTWAPSSYSSPTTPMNSTKANTSINTNLLWLKGHPGTGKSTLMTFLRTHITTSPLPPMTATFFFYANGRPLQKSQLGMFRSLLHQLYTKQHSARKEILAAYRAKVERLGKCGRDWEWGVDELRHLLSQIVIQERRDDLIILIDALDEATDDAKAAEELIGYFHSLSERAASSGATATTKICISRRHYPAMLARKGLVISVEEENGQDLALWVRDQLKNRVEGWENEPEQVHLALEQAIVSKAGRLFLWARLRVDDIIETLNNGACSFEDLRQLVDGESNELSSLYVGMVVKNIPAYLRSRSLHFMQWVCLAERPLSVQEIRYAMACDASYVDEEVIRCEESKGFVENDLRMEKLVKSLSGGLVEVRYHGHGSTIQPFHQTVTEYFSGPGLKALAVISDPALSSKSEKAIVGISEDRLSMSCLNYLNFEQVLQAANLEVSGIQTRLVFIQYAAKYWMLHAERAERRGVPQGALVERFIPGFGLFDTWKLIHYETDQWDSHRDSDLIHVFAASNLLSAVVALLDKGIFVDDEDLAGSTALHHAARRGHEKMVELLLERGAKIGVKNRSGNTPLQSATINGCLPVVRLLLKRGADIDEKTGQAGDALQAAAVEGNLRLVSILVACGADVNAFGGFYGTALQGAAYGGHEEVVRFLMDHDAELNTQGGFYGSALQAAVLARGSKTRRDSVVNLLLEYIVDCNVQGGQHGNALQAAVAINDARVVRLLLKNGADVNAKGGEYGTALQAACYSCDIELVRLLLSLGADVNAEGGEYGSAIQAAASMNDNDEIILLLLQKGADINLGGGRYGSALQAASASPGAGAVRILLEHGAQLSVRGGIFDNVLQAAVYADNEQAAKWFLENGLDINLAGGEHGQALQASIMSCKEDFIRYLLDKKADVNAQGGKHGNALRAAIFWNREPIVKLLLERGADPNLAVPQDQVMHAPYGSALDLAAGKGRLNIVKMLLEHGADVNIPGEWSGNALGAAISSGHKEVVELLLGRGADPDKLDQDFGGNFLVAEGNQIMMKLLREERRKRKGWRERNMIKALEPGDSMPSSRQ